MNKLSCHSDRSPCPLAHALDVVGDRWTLLIVRDLMFRNIHEYKELLRSFEGIASNILSDRLKKLAQAGLVASVSHPESKLRKLYYLTPAGKDLIHVIIELALWSDNHIGTASIPPDIAASMRGGRKKLIADTRRALKAWEAKFVLRPATKKSNG